MFRNWIFSLFLKIFGIFIYIAILLSKLAWTFRLWWWHIWCRNYDDEFKNIPPPSNWAAKESFFGRTLTNFNFCHVPERSTILPSVLFPFLHFLWCSTWVKHHWILEILGSFWAAATRLPLPANSVKYLSFPVPAQRQILGCFWAATTRLPLPANSVKYLSNGTAGSGVCMGLKNFPEIIRHCRGCAAQALQRLRRCRR